MSRELNDFEDALIVRNIVLAASRPDADGDPIKEAISDGWDKKEDFSLSAHQVLQDLEVDPSFDESPEANKHARELGRILLAFQKQSQKWQTSFNRWLSGTNPDFHKLAQGLGESVISIQQVIKMLPHENWKTAGAVKEGHEAVVCFEQAMKGLQHLHAQGASGAEPTSKNLVLGPGVLNEDNTKALQKTTLKAKSQGDFESALISAGFYAKKLKKTEYLYAGNSFGHLIWRVSDKPDDFLNSINNTGRSVIAVTPELTVTYHRVR